MPPSQPGLRRVLGFWSVVSIIVGTVIGGGIFLVPKYMIQSVGSPAMVFAVWVFGGVLSLFGALTYAELSAALPEAGGEYVYLREAYGQFAAFLYGWTQSLVAKPASIATLATGFFAYCATFVPSFNQVWFAVPLPIGPNGSPLEVRSGQLFAMVVIAGLGVVNYFGVRLGGNTQIVVTALKVGLIAAVILIGLLSSQGTVANFTSSAPAPGGISGFFAALVAALWAYDGWNNAGMVASEVRDPQRSFPRALIGGTAAVIAIYILTNLAYFYVLPASSVAASERVASEMMQRIAGSGGAAAVSIAAMISIFAALNGSILSGSRVPYALARDGYFFSPVAKVHPKFQTPGVSILILSFWSAVLVLTGRYKELYTLVIFPSWILYSMAAASVIVLRAKRPDLPRPYRVIGYPIVPLVFVIVALALLAQTFIDSPRESLLGLVLMAIGIPFYLYWRKHAQVRTR